MNYKSSKKSVSFKAQARTIDHLGKGQIADAPTAISELWKNSYDAYARDVALHLYDGKIKCGAIIDNGCGMTYEQLSDSWLTIGTASKSKKQLLPEQDRFNLEDRFTQGEKGIGRLSTAFLAPVTLIVTKKINSRYSAALIDWRLFENTYLALHDIKVPMDEFDDIDQLPNIYTELQTEMLLNLALIPDKEKPEELIIRSAWENFTSDELEAFELSQNKKEAFISTEEKIKNLCKEFKFNDRYLDTWKELLSKVEGKDIDGEKHGTALFLIDLNRDLELMTNRGSLDRNAPEYIAIEKDLVDTLRAFVDPFDRNEKNDFHYEIKSFSFKEEIINESKDILKYIDVFNSTDFSNLEHRVEGIIDNKGWFRGEIIAFGKSYENVAFPCRSLGMPLETLTGEFGVKLGTFELEKSKSSHTDTEVDFLTKQAEKHAGLMIFRDSLRVLPYGKADNDFFEIDDRRNKNAGRYHWATRRIFGHVSLHQNINKELKDKAGREGFIKNRVTREFKELMINLLLNSADKYFGSKSEDRQIMLYQLAKDKKKAKRCSTIHI
ncbi:ATP-binding protein [Photobacterium phosphoreum]|uniref:ATP-binding protein n=1 Tax=Photobacterium phosphoreum TaxID=659 RepID=UPI0009ED8CD2|nr:ATP-binding protein [Photobacterium phosphoreum]